jgi:hypothetical protein
MRCCIRLTQPFVKPLDLSMGISESERQGLDARSLSSSQTQSLKVVKGVGNIVVTPFTPYRVIDYRAALAATGDMALLEVESRVQAARTTSYPS